MIELQVGVKVLLKNSEGKFLFLRRNPKKYPEVGPKWDIVGGRINPGTSLLENLKREVLEETGLVLSTQPKLVGAQDIFVLRNYQNKKSPLPNPPHQGEGKKHIDKHVVRLTYTGEIEGQVKIDEESVEFGWFSEEEVKNINKKEIDQYFKELVDKGVVFL
jgi:8-oxo-dGTP pyrophosphatase MutT (NUDIX family)